MKKKYRRDHLVPLRKKHPRRRVDKTDGRRNGQGARTRKIRSLWQRIVELTFGSIEAVPHEYNEKLHEILEDVL